MLPLDDCKWDDSFPAPGPRAAVRIIIDQLRPEGKRYCFVARINGTPFSPDVTLDEFSEYCNTAAPVKARERLRTVLGLDHPNTLIEVEVFKNDRYVLHKVLKEAVDAGPKVQLMVIAFNYPEGDDAARVLAEGHAANLQGIRAIACPRDPKGTWPVVELIPAPE